LINEILDLSKVEAGKMPIEPKSVEIDELKWTIEQTFRPVAEHRSLQFGVEVAPGVPESMYTDSIRLQQVLKNLLSNAFKFTEKGSVKMTIHTSTQHQKFGVETLNQSQAVVAFSVKDTGIGIPADKQTIIFEAFQQADGTTSRKYGGTGLGLTISREIARLLGGMIDVESVPGEGSTFTLYLPAVYTGVDAVGIRALEKSVEDRSLPPVPPDTNFGGKKVLLVDDDRRNIFAITSVLQNRGLTVLHAENGQEGIDVLKQNPDIQLVLMDTMMPHKDGIEATHEIRQMDQFKSLPIISLTAKAMKGDREKCLEAGASDYITKPVDPERLMAFIHLWLNHARN
jgi:CheY-like chemotaxis protein